MDTVRPISSGIIILRRLSLLLISFSAATTWGKLPLQAAKKLAKMRKIWHLQTCDTCRKIITANPALQSIDSQEVKSLPPSPEQIDELAKLAGSYAAIFNYRSQVLKGVTDRKALNETQLREYLVSHYSCLKRPLVVVGNKVFAGNAAATIQAAVQAIESTK